MVVLSINVEESPVKLLSNPYFSKRGKFGMMALDKYLFYSFSFC